MAFLVVRARGREVVRVPLRFTPTACASVLLIRRGGSANRSARPRPGRCPATSGRAGRDYAAGLLPYRRRPSPCEYHCRGESGCKGASYPTGPTSSSGIGGFGPAFGVFTSASWERLCPARISIHGRSAPVRARCPRSQDACDPKRGVRERRIPTAHMPLRHFVLDGREYRGDDPPRRNLEAARVGCANGRSPEERGAGGLASSLPERRRSRGGSDLGRAFRRRGDPEPRRAFRHRALRMRETRGSGRARRACHSRSVSIETRLKPCA